MKKYIYYFVTLMLVVTTACEDDEGVGVRPEALTDFLLLTPSNGQSLTLNSGTPEETVTITWEASEAGLGSGVKYVWLMDEVGGDFSDPLFEVPSDEDSTATSLILTQDQIDEILGSAGLSQGSSSNFIWTVRADNGTFQKTAETSYGVFLQRFGAGIKEFSLTSPANQMELVLDENKPSEEISITWEVPELVNTTDVTYQWLVVNKGGGFDTPLLELDSDNEGKDAVITLTNMMLDDALAALGVSRASSIDLQWAVRATSGEVSLLSSDVFDITLARFGTPLFPEQLFIVGGSTSAGWDENNVIPFVPVGDGQFEIYAYITVDGFGFKFLEQEGTYDGDWGLDPVDATKVVQEGESNGTVASDGFYRIFIDYNDLSYTIEASNWGIIGTATSDITGGNGWENDEDLVFVGGKGSYTWTITDITLLDGVVKFRQNDAWEIDFGDDGADGTLDFKGAEIPVSAGTYDVTFTLDPVNGYSYSISN